MPDFVEKLDLVMQGTITAESDISISPPDHSAKEGLATVLTLPEKSVWRGGHIVKTVYIPGSSLRGALRNGAARAVAADRAGRQRRMTPEDFLLVAKGGIKDRKEAGRDERVVDYEAAAKLRREEPIVSLFGAMAMKIAGRWQVGDAVPVEPVTPDRKGRGVRSHPFQRQPELAGYMSENAYNEFLEQDRKRVEANVDEDKAEDLDRKIARERKRPEPDNDRIEQWESESKALKERAGKSREEAGGAVNIQQILGGWQAIPEGTEMNHRMRLRDVTEDELAWAFFTLRRLAREGRLGAHESRGEGYFRAEYDLRLARDGGDFKEAGRLRIEDFGLHLDGGERTLESAFARSLNVLNAAPEESA